MCHIHLAHSLLPIIAPSSVADPGWAATKVPISLERVRNRWRRGAAPDQCPERVAVDLPPLVLVWTEHPQCFLPAVAVPGGPVEGALDLPETAGLSSVVPLKILTGRSANRASVRRCTAWTCAPEKFLGSTTFDKPARKFAFDEGFDTMLTITARRDWLDVQIRRMARLGPPAAVPGR